MSHTTASDMAGRLRHAGSSPPAQSFDGGGWWRRCRTQPHTHISHTCMGSEAAHHDAGTVRMSVGILGLMLGCRPSRGVRRARKQQPHRGRQAVQSSTLGAVHQWQYTSHGTPGALQKGQHSRGKKHEASHIGQYTVSGTLHQQHYTRGAVHSVRGNTSGACSTSGAARQYTHAVRGSPRARRDLKGPCDERPPDHMQLPHSPVTTVCVMRVGGIWYYSMWHMALLYVTCEQSSDSSGGHAW